MSSTEPGRYYPTFENGASIEYIVLIKDIEACIVNEIKLSKYYTVLSLKAPSETSKNMLTEFSADCMNNALNLINSHFAMTGRRFETNELFQPQINDYNNSLSVCFFTESEGYKKYSDKYIKASTQTLKSVFYMIAAVKAQHSMRMPLLYIPG